MEFQDRPLRKSGEAFTSSPDSIHVVSVGQIRHDDGSLQSVVEVSERHGEHHACRRFDLSTVVHALLNLDDGEVFALEGRMSSVPH